MTQFKEIRRLAAYDQEKARTVPLLREMVWVYRQSLIDEGGELNAMTYMAMNLGDKTLTGSGGSHKEAHKTTVTMLIYAVQLLSEHIGEIE